MHGTAAEDVPYWILDTDYTNYSVVWSCSENAGVNARKFENYFDVSCSINVSSFYNAEVTWILTREIKPDPSIVRTAMEVLSRNGLGRTSMVTTNHRSNCR